MVFRIWRILVSISSVHSKRAGLLSTLTGALLSLCPGGRYTPRGHSKLKVRSLGEAPESPTTRHRIRRKGDLGRSLGRELPGGPRIYQLPIPPCGRDFCRSSSGSLRAGGDPPKRGQPAGRLVHSKPLLSVCSCTSSILLSQRKSTSKSGGCSCNLLIFETAIRTVDSCTCSLSLACVPLCGILETKIPAGESPDEIPESGGCAHERPGDYTRMALYGA